MPKPLLKFWDWNLSIFFRIWTWEVMIKKSVDSMRFRSQSGHKTFAALQKRLLISFPDYFLVNRNFVVELEPFIYDYFLLQCYLLLLFYVGFLTFVWFKIGTLQNTKFQNSTFQDQPYFWQAPDSKTLVLTPQFWDSHKKLLSSHFIFQGPFYSTPLCLLLLN